MGGPLAIGLGVVFAASLGKSLASSFFMLILLIIWDLIHFFTNKLFLGVSDRRICLKSKQQGGYPDSYQYVPQI
jgi:hypothetical protein